MCNNDQITTIANMIKELYHNCKSSQHLAKANAVLEKSEKLQYAASREARTYEAVAVWLNSLIGKIEDDKQKAKSFIVITEIFDKDGEINWMSIHDNIYDVLIKDSDADIVVCVRR